eukprot:6377344-Lingulodinium_polyedra.AAC.1
MRLASRCGGGRSIQPHHRAAFRKRNGMMRPNRPSAAATARKSHARALHARTSCWRARSARACRLLVATAADGRIDRV